MGADPPFDEPAEERPGATTKRRALVRSLLERLPVFRSTVVTRRERLAVGASLAVLVAVAIAVSAHLLWARQHMRPKVRLDANLIVAADPLHSANAGLIGYRISAANGLEVNDKDELDAAIGAGGGRFLLTEAVRAGSEPGERRRTFWWERRTALQFDLDPDGVVLSVDPPPPDGAPAVVGARMTQISGEPFADVSDAQRALGRNRSTLRLTFSPPDSTAEVADLVVVRLDWRVQFTLLLVGVVFGCLGFGVYLVKPDLTSSWGFLTFCFVVSLSWMLRSIPEFYRTPLESTAHYLSQCSLPFAALCFFGTFSSLPVLLPSLKPVLSGAAGLGVLLLAANGVLYPDEAARRTLGTPLFLLLLVTTLAIIALSQQSGRWFRRRGLSVGPTDRQRAIALRLAALLGFLPLTAFYVLMIAQRVDLSRRLWVELAVFAFPAIVAYAIVRHNLLRLNELAREGLAIGLLMLGLGLAYATATAGVAPLTERVLGAGGGLSQGLVVAASALVLAPLYAGTRRRLLHRFHRAEHLDDYLQTLADLADRQRNLDTFCDEVVLITSSALSHAGASLLLRQTSTGTWRLAASTVDPRPRINIEQCGPLLQVLVGSRTSLDQHEILEDRRFGAERQSLLTGWKELDAALLVPLRCRDRLVGALILGDKPGRAGFTAPELRFVDRLRTRLDTGLARWFTPAPHHATTTTAMYPAYPEAIGRYRVDRLLGEGAMCYVYLANADDRDVAIKVPKPKTLADDVRLERFLRESRAMKRITHPHIVRILDDGIARGEPFIVVEYFPDGSFNRHLNRERTIPAARALGLVRDLATGLEAALERGIVHRDIKPANIFLASADRIKLGDFGIANVADEATLTEPGTVLGSPAYMSPEAARGLKATWSSDQYSLGICLFEMLAGERPFTAPTLEGLLHKHMSEPIPDLRQRFGLGDGTQRILVRMTEKTPEHRFASYHELIDTLAAVVEGPRTRA